MSGEPIAIIGAGVAGIACARRLRDEGRSVTLFEKSRGIGGRLATRRTDGGLAFDHGAQFVTARSQRFADLLKARHKEGAASLWHPIVAGDGIGAAQSAEWFVGVPAMNLLVKPDASDMDIQFRQRVVKAAHSPDGWRLIMADDRLLGPFETLVVTAPAPQTRAMLPTCHSVQDAMQQVEIAPCWAVLVAFETALELNFDVWRSDSGTLAWASRNSGKPGRAGTAESWVLHASPAWSVAHLEETPDQITAPLLAAFAELCGSAVPNPLMIIGHRWRYAKTLRPLGRSYLGGFRDGLFVGGDWCLGGRVECAFQSGEAIAEAIFSDDLPSPTSASYTSAISR